MRGRVGTQDPPALWVAGVALGDIEVPFAWQAWRCSHPPAFCVAGVALGDLRLVWQAWRLGHWAGFGGALGCR